MKLITTQLFAFLLLISSFSFAQKSVFDIVNESSKVVFVGIDFRQTKFLGSAGFLDPEKIQNVYLQEWNSIYLKEYEKYSFAENLKLSAENYAVSIANMIKLNESVIVKDNITNEMDYEIPEDQIQSIVNDYELKTKEGIGVAYIVETLNSFENNTVAYAVFFDLSDNHVFFKQKVVTSAGGIGFKNFWIRSIYNIQDEYFSKWYKKWKKQSK